ncbi:FliM/FliN family flagellar motor switch protein [Pandoraea pneumonica]
MSAVSSNGVPWRALHAWSKQQCSALESHWCDQLRSFMAQWSAGATLENDVRVTTAVPEPHEKAHAVLGLYATQDSTSQAWLWASSGSGTQSVPRAMAAALFGHSAGALGEASLGVACDALAVLAQSLGFDRYETEHALPLASLAEPWAGGLWLSFSMGTSRWTVALSARAVERLVERLGVPLPTPDASRIQRHATVPLREAVGNARVTLRAKFAGPSLTLGALADLREGDIVALPHDLSTPLRIETSTGDPVCFGYLGRRADRLAIELTGGDTSLNFQEQK